jgi:CRISPR-associated exonuclease Cas4
MNWHLTVSDLKQWTYCPRVVFYTYCMPRLRPQTFKMEASQETHEEEKGRERRRTGQLYDLPDAERVENVRLESDTLGVSALIDLVLRKGERAWPVDYKLSEHLKTAEHFKLQLTAYGLLLEEAWGVRCESGFLYGLGQRKVEEVRLTPRLRGQVQQTIGEIRAAIDAERMPEPTAQRSRCVNCEFRRFCNDVF